MFGGEDRQMKKEINPTIKNLIALLSSSDDIARTEACKSLIAIGEPAVPFLVEALENSNHLGRWEAAKALGTIGDPTTAQALIQALEDEEFEVRWRAAEGLTKMGVNGLKPLLRALIKDGDSVSLRDGAHHVLHNVERGEVKNYLLPVLVALESTWPSVEVPAAALRALERLEQFQKTHGKLDAGYFKGLATTTSNQPADLGARRRARRYAKSLQYRAI
jgi:HEAT repeat protein